MNQNDISLIRSHIQKNRLVDRLFPPASNQEIEDSEREIGHLLWKDHSYIIRELANGGFGPSDGILGVKGGAADEYGRTILELRLALFETEDLNGPIIPICEWGGGVWSCINCNTGEIYTYSELGMIPLEVNFSTWLLEWVKGKDWWEEITSFETRESVNPNTGSIVRTSVMKLPDDIERE